MEKKHLKFVFALTLNDKIDSLPFSLGSLGEIVRLDMRQQASSFENS